jgi:predicted nucleotidyltransferase
MDTKKAILEEVTKTLKWLLNSYEDQGLVSIYLWGSIITPDFNPETSDIDAVAFLSDNADFKKLNEIRRWLPDKNPNLVRLQVNFFYVSELTKEKPVRSRLGRLSTPEQAIYDFPFWQYVCGERINGAAFPDVKPKQFLIDQIKVVQEREEWAVNPKTPNDIQYYCKSLVWLCWAVQKLHHQKSVFSWKTLDRQATKETRQLVDMLVRLKQSGWNQDVLKEKLPTLIEYGNKLISTSLQKN